MKIIGTLRDDGDGRGTVAVEEVYPTSADDLWQACTDPERLARWIADVSGDLRAGGDFQARFTSGWEGRGRIDVYEPPQRLVVTTVGSDEPGEHMIVATLTPTGDGTTLTIEERGLPAAELPAYGAGWQIHLEDLAATLAGGSRADLRVRFGELIPAYRELEIHRRPGFLDDPPRPA